MRTVAFLGLAAAAALWCLAAFAQEPPGREEPATGAAAPAKTQAPEWSPKDPQEKELKEQVDRLLEQLENGSFKERKESTAKLRELIRESNGTEEVLAAYIGRRLDGAVTFEARYRLRKVLDYYLRPWNCIEMKRSLNDHSSYVMSVAFSPDGKMLASGGGHNDSTVKIWNPQSGECLRTLEGHTGFVYCVAFSPDGKTVASAGQDGTVRIWDPLSGECRRKVEGHMNQVYSVAFSPDGKWMASASADHTLKTWNVKTGKCVHILSHTGSFNGTAFSPDSRLLASASSDGGVRIWDLGNGKCVRTLAGHVNQANSVSFSPDGKLLASAGNDNTIRVWNVDKGECLRKIEGGSGTRLVAFSPDGSMLASANDAGRVRILDPHSGECLRVLTGHYNYVYSVAFSRDGTTLASGGQDTTIVLWSIPKANGKCKPEHKEGESNDDEAPEGGKHRKGDK